jgi:hypothetical protein
MFCYNNDFRAIMLAAYDLGMIKPGYAFMLGDVPTRTTYMSDDGRDEDAKTAFHGVLGVAMTPRPDSSAYSSFLVDYKQRFEEEHGYAAPNELNPYTMGMYDAVYLYAHTLGSAVRSGVDYKDGRRMMQILHNTSFELLGSVVEVDEFGNREMDWSLYNWKTGAGSRRVGDYSSSTDDLSFEGFEPIVWTGNVTDAPVGVDVTIGLIIPRTGWAVFDEMSVAAKIAIDQVHGVCINDFCSSAEQARAVVFV